MNKLRKLIFSFVCITSLVAVSGCSNLIEDLKPKVIDIKQFSASELGLTSISKASSKEDLIVDPSLIKGKDATEDDVIMLKNWGYGTTTVVITGVGPNGEKEETKVDITVQKSGAVKYHITKQGGEVEDITWKKSGSTETETSVVKKPDGTTVDSTKVTKTSKKTTTITQKSETKNTDGTVETWQMDATENKDGSYKIVNHIVVVDENGVTLSDETETIELTSDGEYSEKSTEVSKDANSNKVETTKEKIVHKDKSETSVTEEVVYDSENKEIKKSINSITKDTEGNVLEARVYQLNEDSSSSDYNYKLNDDGSSTESNVNKKADGSEEKVSETKDKDANIIASENYIKNAADGSSSDYIFKANNDGTQTEENAVIDSEGLSNHSIVTKDKDSKVIAFEGEITHHIEQFALEDIDENILIDDKYKDCVIISCNDEGIVTTKYDFDNVSDDEIKYAVTDSNGYKTEVVVTIGEKGKIVETIKPIPYGNIIININNLIPCLKIENRNGVLSFFVDSVNPYILGECTWYVNGEEKGKGETLNVSEYEPGEYYIVVTDNEAFGAFILQK